MQAKISPGVAAAVIIVVVAIAAFFGWRAVGSGPKVHEAQSMSKFMGGGTNKSGPPPSHGAGHSG